MDNLGNRCTDSLMMFSFYCRPREGVAGIRKWACYACLYVVRPGFETLQMHPKILRENRDLSRQVCKQNANWSLWNLN